MTTTLLVTGHKAFVHRHRGLLDALTAHGIALKLVTTDDFVASRVTTGVARRLQRLVGRLASPERAEFWFHKSAGRFTARSRRLGALLDRQPPADAVLQFFLMHRPYAGAAPARPTFYVTDYTMALARRTWPAWAPFPTDADAQAWLALEGEAYRQARLVFAMSEAVKASLVADYGVDSANVRVIGSAPNHEAPVRVRERVGTVLVNGSDFVRKGADLAVAAMARLARDAPGIRLVVVGARVPDTGNVTSLGPVGDPAAMARLFDEADLVLAPARCDPFPTFVIEAQQAGIPVICSDHDGMPEIVRDGESGLVLADPNADAIADAIRTLADDPVRLRRYSVEAHRQAQRFAWPLIGATVAAEIEAALARA